MNAFNTVNLASALILTSTKRATALHIPPSKWIYPLSGAGTRDPDAFWHRPNFHSSPSISYSLDAALSLASLTPADIDLFDFYSCFPIVPKLAAHHLNLPITDAEAEGKENGKGKRVRKKELTLLGGLTSFGGAGNNYSMNALTEMTRQLRAGKGKRGLVLCNGGVLSYQFVNVLSREPVKGAQYPLENPLPEVLEGEVPEIVERPEGEAVVEVCI